MRRGRERQGCPQGLPKDGAARAPRQEPGRPSRRSPPRRPQAAEPASWLTVCRVRASLCALRAPLSLTLRGRAAGNNPFHSTACCRSLAPTAEHFQALQAAYNILIDPVKRRRFDTTGCTDEESEGFWAAYREYRRYAWPCCHRARHRSRQSAARGLPRVFCRLDTRAHPWARHALPQCARLAPARPVCWAASMPRSQRRTLTTLRASIAAPGKSWRRGNLAQPHAARPVTGAQAVRDTGGARHRRPRCPAVMPRPMRTRARAGYPRILHSTEGRRVQNLVVYALPPCSHARASRASLGVRCGRSALWFQGTGPAPGRRTRQPPGGRGAAAGAHRR